MKLSLMLFSMSLLFQAPVFGQDNMPKPAPAISKPLALKGLVAGASLESIQALPDFIWGQPKHSDDEPLDIIEIDSERGSSFTLAGNRPRYLVCRFVNADGGYKLFSVLIGIHPETYLAIVTALQEKYGEPQDLEKTQVQNAMGATFMNVVARWRNQRSKIEVHRFTSSLDYGAVMLTETTLESSISAKRDTLPRKTPDI